MSKPDGICWEDQAKVINDWVSTSETHFSKLCIALGMYSTKLAKARDCSDSVASVLHKQAGAECLTASIRKSLQLLAELIATAGDHRDEQVRNLEAGVTRATNSLEAVCREARSLAKYANSSVQGAKSAKSSLEKLVIRNTSSTALERAELKLKVAEDEAADTGRALRKGILKLYSESSSQLKKLLETVILTEISSAAKLLQLYTDAYKVISAIDENTDAQEFEHLLDSSEDLKEVANLKVADDRHSEAVNEPIIPEDANGSEFSMPQTDGQTVSSSSYLDQDDAIGGWREHNSIGAAIHHAVLGGPNSSDEEFSSGS